LVKNTYDYLAILISGRNKFNLSYRCQIFITKDAGASWTAVPGTHPTDQNTWNNLIAVHPIDKDIIFAGEVGIKRSSDGGFLSTKLGTYQKLSYKVKSENIFRYL
jgi:hypothetical protein